MAAETAAQLKRTLCVNIAGTKASEPKSTGSNYISVNVSVLRVALVLVELSLLLYGV